MAGIRLHMLQVLPTPYNDVFYRALDQCEGIDLRVYYLMDGSWRRPWNSELGIGYPSQYRQRVLGVDWGLLNKAWSDRDSLFVVPNWGHLAFLSVVLVRYLRRAPVSMWVDVPQEAICGPPLKRWARRLLLKWLLPRLDVIFGTGKPAQDVLRRMGARPEQLVNLPFFVDLDRPIQARHDPGTHTKVLQLRKFVGCTNNGMVFSMIGSLVKIKGHDIGLQAFARCKQQSNTPIGLLITGEGPEREGLERLVDELHLGECVSFLGWKDPNEMDAIYLASDVVLHPSRQDPFPVVVLEAMSWSKVVIGSNVCGSVEDRIQNGVNGYSFPGEDVVALVRIMVDLVNHPDKLQEMGRKARMTAEEWPVRRGVEIVLQEAQRRLGMPRIH